MAVRRRLAPVAGRAGWESQRQEAAAPYQVVVGAERCAERFVRVRRPMFDRVFVRGDYLVALPRRGTKTATAVAFELVSGREVELAALPVADGQQMRLDYLSSPVGRGPSQLWLVAGQSTDPWRTMELPDAICGVVEAPFGWYVGCRDGFLYALDRDGDQRWRWQTPGAAVVRSAGPGQAYFRPCPYRLASNGRSALVGWWGNLWSVSPDGQTEWQLHLEQIEHPQGIQIRLPTLEVAAQTALGEIKQAYREAVKRTHPDLHPDDPTAAARFRQVQEAYESATSRSVGGGRSGRVGAIRYCLPPLLTVSFLDGADSDWLVGSSGGTLYRLSSRGRLVARVRLGSGAVFPIRDCTQTVVAICSYPIAGRSQPNLWFVDAPAPVRLCDPYPWPDHLRGSYGSYLLAQRPHGRTLGLIDESGALAVQLRCPRPIRSVCAAEGALVVAAGALICLEIDGLSPLTRSRVWQPPFTGKSFHEPTDPGTPPTGPPRPQRSQRS
jgi:DnaJ domain/PQQ enzyme repeat